MVTGTCVSALASHDRNGSFNHATVASFNRSLPLFITASLLPRRSNAPHPLAVGLLFLPPKFHTRLRQHFLSSVTCQRFRKRRSRACGTALQRRRLSQRQVY